MAQPLPITVYTNEITLDTGQVLDRALNHGGAITATRRQTMRVPTWPKTEYTKQQLLDMVLEACPNPRRLYYVDLGATHGACAIH